MIVGQEDPEDSIPAEGIVGNMAHHVQDILQVVAVVVVLLFGVEAYRSQDEVVDVGVHHLIGIVEEGVVDGIAS